MYSFDNPERDSFGEPSGLIVISVLLLVLNSEYSFVDKRPEAFIINAVIELMVKVKRQ